MAERLKAHAWRACSPKGVVGSNPTPSASSQRNQRFEEVAVRRPFLSSLGRGLVSGLGS
jgi:hypothetical protein